MLQTAFATSLRPRPALANAALALRLSNSGLRRANFSTTPSLAGAAPPADRAAETLPPVHVSKEYVEKCKDHVMSTLDIVQPVPVVKDFIRDTPVSGKEIEQWHVGVGLHRVPVELGDRFAKSLVVFLRFFADTFFRERYLARGVMLETVAAIPGQVAGSLRHLSSLRRIRHDGGFIHHLLHEAENERMHLMTWQKMIQPSLPERILVVAAQGVMWNAYFLLYLMFPKVAHRFVGYLEEEAVISYTHMLEAIDAGKLENVDAPQIAKNYWNLMPDAKLRDVVLAIRADEANHRDTNHHLCDRLSEKKEDLRVYFDARFREGALTIHRPQAFLSTKSSLQDCGKEFSRTAKGRFRESISFLKKSLEMHRIILGFESQVFRHSSSSIENHVQMKSIIFSFCYFGKGPARIRSPAVPA